MALELMGSPSIELRGVGIRLLILHFSSNDGKLDNRQVIAFEKANGFHAMAKQLCSSGTGCCDDLILDGLFSLLFWQVNGLLPRQTSANGESQRRPEGTMVLVATSGALTNM